MSGFSINVAVHSGNLTRDPELRTLPSGRPVCRVGVAVNERYKDSDGDWQDRAHYFDWDIWGGLGEWVASNMQQGDGITLEGRARWRSWETDEGSKRSMVSFTADSVIPRKGGGGGGQSARDKRMEEENQADGFEPRSDVPSDTSDFEPAHAGSKSDDDDIPF